LAELRQKMAEKRAKKAEEDAKEHKISETIRRKAGQVRRTIILQSFIPTFEKDLGQIKEELEKKQALKEAEQKKKGASGHILISSTSSMSHCTSRQDRGCPSQSRCQSPDRGRQKGTRREIRP
jgi:hypothetical protein